MMINDIVALLMGIPTPLAIGWGAWFVVGLALSIWSRREKARLVVHGYGYEHEQPAPRPKSGPRASARPAAKITPAAAPHASGDAFGDLEALFNEVQEGAHRTPGEPSPTPQPAAPATSEPLRNAPVLAAPQSLP
jgi:hypothetical protein